jgi:hypothetical protein
MSSFIERLPNHKLACCGDGRLNSKGNFLMIPELFIAPGDIRYRLPEFNKTLKRNE